MDSDLYLKNTSDIPQDTSEAAFYLIAQGGRGSLQASQGCCRLAFYGLKTPKKKYRHVNYLASIGRDYMTDIGYAWEKLHLSVITLATWSNTIQERLADAYLYNLMGLQIEIFPRELQGEFRDIQNALNSLSREGEEYKHNINRKISKIEANELAKRIISLYDHVTRLDAIRDQ